MDPHVPQRELTKEETTERRRLWLEERKSGLGGSDMAAVMGLLPYGRTRLDVWREKTGKATSPDVDSPDKHRGRIVEPILLRLYQEETGRLVTPAAPMLRHKDVPYLFANPDAITFPPLMFGDNGSLQKRVLEVKSPRLHVHRRWKAEGLPGKFLIQLNTYMEVTEIPRGAFVFGNLEGMEVVHFDFDQDKVLCAQILAAAEEFWTRWVETDTPPPDDQALPPIELPDAKGDVVKVQDPRLDTLAGEYFEASEVVKMAEAIKEDVKEKLRQLFGKNPVVEGEWSRLYFGFQGGRTTFDHKALASVRPVDRARVAAEVMSLLGAESMGPLDFQACIGAVSAMLDRSVLDLAPFTKVGKSFETFKAYHLKPGSSDE